jgi:hypothetical protein
MPLEHTEFATIMKEVRSKLSERKEENLRGKNSDASIVRNPPVKPFYIFSRLFNIG